MNARGKLGPPRTDVKRSKRKKTKPKKKGPYDDLKLEVAHELGLMEKVRRRGWAELTAAESGRIGGIMTRRLRDLGLVPKPTRTDLLDKSPTRETTSSITRASLKDLARPCRRDKYW